MEKLGGDIEKIASHSVRKRCSILCVYGVIVSPPMVSIYLRAGWSLGNAKDIIWIHYEKADAQYFGRTVVCISPLSINFAVPTA